MCGRVAVFLLLILFSGCSSPARLKHASARQFDFARDTFSYPNELVWEYSFNENGKWTGHRRAVKPTYSQHCFVVARSACQFFQNAVFDPGLPMVEEETYRKLVRRLISTNPREALPEDRKIVFPGYADLRSFSQVHGRLLKEECGGAWQCYFQRGNWRMIFPFSRHHQQNVAEQLKTRLDRKSVAVVHVVRFPQLSINHAMLMFGVEETSNEIHFLTYDPNEPEKQVRITYDRAARTFYLPANAYFSGGRIDVYPIYDRSMY